MLGTAHPSGERMGKNLAEFRLLGIDVKVHWSFILILAFGAFVYGAGPAGWLVGGLYGVAHVSAAVCVRDAA